MSLRAILNLTVIRPTDANETSIAWRLTVDRQGPVALIFTRQKFPVLDSQRYPIKQGVPQGVYILMDAKSRAPDIVLIATCSEVYLALNASKALSMTCIATRVVSIPSWELFEEQTPTYRSHVLPSGVAKLAIEAGVTLRWEKFVGDKSAVMGINCFGASVPGNLDYTKYRFDIENVVNRILALLQRNKQRVDQKNENGKRN